MSLTLKKQRDGTVRPFWYGEYINRDGKREVVNLNIPITGTPPASGSLRDEGDRRFEASRAKAREALEKIQDEQQHKGRADHLIERLIESKTGQKVQHVRLDQFPARWRTTGRESPAGEKHLRFCDLHFRNFTDFMKKRSKDAVYAYQVSPEDAATYVTDLRTHYSRNTVRTVTHLLNKAFARFLPTGTANPFAGFVGRKGSGSGETIHRTPFTPEELKKLLDAAEGDDFTRPLIITAACTGMRRGDVCRLKWSDVDLAGNMLTVKTGKTGANVEIPVFSPLEAVLIAQKGKDSKYVFPDAARMLTRNPDGLTRRFKAIVVKALDTERPEVQHPPSPRLSHDARERIMDAIARNIPDGERKTRLQDTFQRYSTGDSLCTIAETTGRSKGTVSYDLHTIQKMAGTPFLRSSQTPSGIRDAIARVTRVDRENGERRASVRDWHALRATFVTLALAAGVPVELVRRVTGHATVEIVLRHYFRPDREQFRAALQDAMPGVLTGKTKGSLTPGEELAILANKVAADTATPEDRKRLRLLAAKV